MAIAESKHKLAHNRKKIFLKRKARGLPRITWCVDLFSNLDNQGSNALVHLLSYLQKNQNQEVEPIYLLSPHSLEWSGTLPSPWLSKLRPLVMESWENFSANLSSLQLLPLSIQSERTDGIEESIKKLVQSARKRGSEYLAVNTHGKGQIQSLVLGSFTEALIQHSTLPLLVSGPNARFKPPLKNLIFCSDLSSSSRRVYARTLKLATQLNANVILCHKLPSFVNPLLQTGVYMMGGGWVSLPSYLDDQEKQLKAKAEKWCEEGRKKGVEVITHLLPREEEICEAVLKLANDHADSVVVVAAQTSAFGSWLIGSVSRQIVRRSPVPTLVFPLKYRY